MAYTDDNDEVGEIKSDNDEGNITVEGTAAYSPPPDDTPNFVPILLQSDEGKKDLQYAADKVCEHFDEDWKSCEGYRTKRTARLKLLVGDLDPKNYPFEECANVHIPVMLKSILRLVHRMYSELFPDRDVVFQAIPSKTLVKERAELVTLHGNWQIKKDIPDFYRQNRRALMEFITNGDCVMHSYRDLNTNRNRHELLNCEEFVFPYVWKTTATDMSDVPRKTRILRKFKNDLVELQAQGAWENIDRIFETEPDHATPPDDEKVRAESDRFEGRKPDESSAAPYKFYEYHGWCKLTGWKTERPVKITVESQTKTVTHMQLRHEADRKDLARFKAQQTEAQQYQDDQGMHQQLLQKEQQLHQRLMEPHVPPDEAVALQQTLAQGHPQPPQPPAWMKEPGQQPEGPRMVPIEEFSHGVCIENVDGSLGLGIGLLLEPFNMAANTAASQFTDSATLANAPPGIKPEGVKFVAGETRLQPGVVSSLRGVTAENVGNAIAFVKFPPANPQLKDIIDLSLQAAEDVSSAPDVLSGEAGKANETYRGIATRVEQATKQLSVLALNYLEMLTNVLRNNARLNRLFMDETEFASVIDPRTMESQEIQVGRDLYEDDFEIMFTADTRFATKQQKVSEADELVGMIKALPPPVAAQIFTPEYMHEAVTRALKARGFYDMAKLLGMPQPIPPTPPPGMPSGPPGLPGAGPPQAGPSQPGPPPGLPPPRPGPPPQANGGPQ